MDRRGFLVSLILVCGCGANEVPKKVVDTTQAVPAAAPPGSQQQSVSGGTRIPRVALLVFGTTDSGSATATIRTPIATLLRNRLTELVSYGPVLETHYALAAEYVDKILKGAKPGDLPVQQPTQFALIINLKTAKGARPHGSAVLAGARG